MDEEVKWATQNCKVKIDEVKLATQNFKVKIDEVKSLQRKEEAKGVCALATSFFQKKENLN